MTKLKTHYLLMFEDEIKELRFVIEKSKEIKSDFRLTEKTRTVLELVNHIAQIPRIDIGIYSGELTSGELTRALENEMNKTSIEAALTVFDEGCDFLREFLKNKKDEDLLKTDLRAFYEDKDSPAKNWVYFLGKIITHLVMHKGILWAYLKAAKLKVNMFTYYGV